MAIVQPRLRVDKGKLACYLAAAAWGLMAISDYLAKDYGAVARDISGLGATLGLPAAWTDGWQILVPDPAADPKPAVPPQKARA